MELCDVHPKALKRYYPGAKYVSRGRQAYSIRQNHLGYWEIFRYRGGLKPKRLQGSFTHFSTAEETLIQYLKSKDKWGKAIYPGSDKRE